MADADDVPIGQQRGHDTLPIDEGAVKAVRVHDAASGRHVAEFGMVAGDAEVGNHDVVIQLPADAQRPGGHPPLPPGGTSGPLTAQLSTGPLAGSPSRTRHSVVISIRSTRRSPS